MVFLKWVVIFKVNTVILYKGGIVLLQFPQVNCYKPMKFSGFDWDYKTYVWSVFYSFETNGWI